MPARFVKHRNNGRHEEVKKTTKTIKFKGDRNEEVRKKSISSLIMSKVEGAQKRNALKELTFVVAKQANSLVSHLDQLKNRYIVLKAPDSETVVIATTQVCVINPVVAKTVPVQKEKRERKIRKTATTIQDFKTLTNPKNAEKSTDFSQKQSNSTDSKWDSKSDSKSDSKPDSKPHSKPDSTTQKPDNHWNPAKLQQSFKTADASEIRRQKMAAFLKQNNQGFSTMNVNSWEGGSASTDRQVSAKLKKQHKSNLDDLDLEYDDEKVELSDRKFERRQKKQVKKAILAKQTKGKKVVNVFQKNHNKWNKNDDKQEDKSLEKIRD